MSEQFEFCPALPQELYDKLTAPLPPAAFDSMENGFTSIKDIFVYERLNQVFGHGGWKTEHKFLGDIQLGLPELVCWCALTVPAFNIRVEGYGGHCDQEKGAGDNYQSALTDAFGKCWKQLGIGAEVWKGEVTKKLYPELDSIQIHAARPTHVKGTDLEYFSGIICDIATGKSVTWMNVAGWTVRHRKPNELRAMDFISFRARFVKAAYKKGVPKNAQSPERFLDIVELLEVHAVKPLVIPETED